MNKNCLEGLAAERERERTLRRLPIINKRIENFDIENFNINKNKIKKFCLGFFPSINKEKIKKNLFKIFSVFLAFQMLVTCSLIPVIAQNINDKSKSNQKKSDIPRKSDKKSLINFMNNPGSVGSIASCLLSFCGGLASSRFIKPKRKTSEPLVNSIKEIISIIRIQDKSSVGKILDISKKIKEENPDSINEISEITDFFEQSQKENLNSQNQFNPKIELENKIKELEEKILILNSGQANNGRLENELTLLRQEILEKNNKNTEQQQKSNNRIEELTNNLTNEKKKSEKQENLITQLKMELENSKQDQGKSLEQVQEKNSKLKIKNQNLKAGLNKKENELEKISTELENQKSALEESNDKIKDFSKKLENKTEIESELKNNSKKLKQIQGEIKNLEQKNLELENEKNSLVQQVENIKKQNQNDSENFEKQIAILENKKNGQEQQLQKADEELQKLKLEVINRSANESRLGQENETKEELLAQLEEENSNLKFQNESLRKKEDASEREEKLAKESEDLRKQINKLIESKSDELSKTKENLENKVRNLKSQNETLISENKDITNSLESEKSKYKELEEKTNESEIQFKKEIDRLNKQNSELQNCNDELLNKIKDLNKQHENSVNEMNENINNLKFQAENFTNLSTRMNSENDKLQNQIEQLTEQNKQLENAFNNLDTTKKQEISDLKNNLKNLENLNTQINTDNEKLQNQVNELTEKFNDENLISKGLIVQKEKLISEAEESIKKNTEEINNLKTMNSQSGNQILELKSNSDKQNGQIEKLENQVNELNEKNSNLEKNLEESQNENSNLKQKILDLTEAKNQFKIKNDEEIKNLKSQLESKESELNLKIQENSKQNQEKEEEIQELKNQNKNLTQEINTLKKTNSELQSQNQNAVSLKDQQITSLNTKIENLEAEIFTKDQQIELQIMKQKSSQETFGEILKLKDELQELKEHDSKNQNEIKRIADLFCSVLQKFDSPRPDLNSFYNYIRAEIDSFKNSIDSPDAESFERISEMFQKIIDISYYYESNFGLKYSQVNYLINEILSQSSINGPFLSGNILNDIDNNEVIKKFGEFSQKPLSEIENLIKEQEEIIGRENFVMGENYFAGFEALLLLRSTKQLKMFEDFLIMSQYLKDPQNFSKFETEEENIILRLKEIKSCGVFGEQLAINLESDYEISKSLLQIQNSYPQQTIVRSEIPNYLNEYFKILDCLPVFQKDFGNSFNDFSITRLLEKYYAILRQFNDSFPEVAYDNIPSFLLQYSEFLNMSNSIAG
ncbi:MAG: hypothetical protein LBJ32_03420, partial [Oscillospiraceae bacterium]|nr:hypothetical protein [Oscillospiraceae bacterium]